MFLDVVRRTGNIRAAARAARLSRTAIYERKRKDATFRHALEYAQEEAVDDLEAELRRRAVEGVEKPVFYGGQQCGAVQTYSDNLGMFLLKGRRRSIFGDGKAVAGGSSPDRQDERQSAMEMLIAKLDAMTLAQPADKDIGNSCDQVGEA